MNESPEAAPSEATALSVDLINAPAPVAGPASVEFEALERLAFAQDAKKALLESQLADEKQDREERVKYSGQVFRLLTCWLAGLGIVVMFEGFHHDVFELETPVMVALIGGTTASVIGIFLVVARYLFPSRVRPNRRHGDPQV